MLFLSFNLHGSCKRDFNTEIRYVIASAKVDGADFVCLSIPRTDDEPENKRLFTCLIKVLGTMKREGSVQFFVTDGDILRMTTEAQYIMNKLSDKLPTASSKISEISVYVKL